MGDVVIDTTVTLASLLNPYRTRAIANATGAHVERVRSWKRGERVPKEVNRIERLAQFLRIDSGKLLKVLARDGQRIAAARAQSTAGVAVA